MPCHPAAAFPCKSTGIVRVMSLLRRTDDSSTAAGMGKEKSRLPFFGGGSASDFIEFYDRLTALIHAKGRRWRQALAGKGPFRDYSFADIATELDDDDFDDMRQEEGDRIFRAARYRDEHALQPADNLSTKSPPPLEASVTKAKKEKGTDEVKDGVKDTPLFSRLGQPDRVRRPPSPLEQPARVPEAEPERGVSERRIQEIYCSICREMYSMILQCLAPEPHRQLRNYGCVAGDGPGAHRLLRRIYQGSGSVALIHMIRSMVNLSMEGKFSSLGAYSSEFRRCSVSLSSLGYNLDDDILKALFLIGLSSSYESVVSTIANAGFDTVSLDQIKESVRSQKDLLHIRDRPVRPALALPPTDLDARDRQQESRGRGSDERKFKCYNCRLVHSGGERQCKAPCRICSSKKHTRYSCPKRNKGKGDHGGGGGHQSAQLAVPSVHLLLKHDTSLLNSQPSNENEDGPHSSRGLPFIDSGAGGIYAAVRRVSNGKGGCDLVFPDNVVHGTVLNAHKSVGLVTTAASTTLPYHVACSLWGLKDVKLVEGLHAHLVGVHPLIHSCGPKKNYVVFGPDHAHLVPMDDLRMPLSARRIGRADGTMFRFDVDAEVVMMADSRPANIFELLHMRTHWPIPLLLKGISDGSILAPSVSQLSPKQLKQLSAGVPPCHSCNLGKAHRRPIHRAYVMPRAIRPLQRIIVDFSSIQPRGANGEFVYMAGIDEYSNRGYVVPAASRALAPECLRLMLKPRIAVRHRFARPVKIELIRGDDAKEFKSDAFLQACADCNAHSCVTAAPYQKNSIARVDTFMKFVQRTGAALMAAYSAPPSEWPFAAIMACDQLWNWKPNSGNRGVSPLELDEGTIPNVEALRTFYAPVYVVKVGSRSSKFSNMALFGRFLGFSRQSLGYVCRVMSSRKLVVRRDVYFVEDIQVGAHLTAVQAQLDKGSSDPGGDGSCDDAVEDFKDAAEDDVKDVEDDAVDVKDAEDAAEDVKVQVDEAPRRSVRNRTPVVRFSDSHLSQHQIYNEIKHAMLAHDAGSIIREQLVEPVFKVKHKIDIAGWSLPRSYKESLNVPDADEWAAARAQEFKNFEDHKVWEECIRPDRNVRILPIAEVYDIKFDMHGKPVKRKYRICAKGFRQIKGIDYHNCYAPVIHADALRMSFCIAVELGLKSLQFDFHAAFLHAPNDVEMYVEVPPGYVCTTITKGDVVLSLDKVIYGMKQSACRFYKLVSTDIGDLGYKQSKASPCLFVKFYGDQNEVALIVLHVDDGGMFAKDVKVLEADLNMLRRKYKLDHEPMSWYVGLRIVTKDDSIGMLCDAYIEACARRFNVDKRPPQTYPAKEAPMKFDGESNCRKKFMELVGCLLYISTACRPDISTITNMLASQMANPDQHHLAMAEDVLCYLYHSRDKGLVFRRTGVQGKSHISKIKSMLLKGYFDSDYAADASRKSRSGVVMFYNDNLVSWMSHLQTMIAQSVFEAETIAGNEGYRIVRYLRKIVADITRSKAPMMIDLFGDNERSIECAISGTYGKRSKHFEVRLLGLSEGHQKRIINLQHVRTADNPADLMTKVVNAEVFKALVDCLVMRV